MSLDLEDQVVAQGDAGVAEGGEEVGDGAAVGELGVGLEVQPRPQDEGALGGARVREPQVLVVGAAVADDDQVDVEGARARS